VGKEGLKEFRSKIELREEKGQGGEGFAGDESSPPTSVDGRGKVKSDRGAGREWMRK